MLTTKAEALSHKLAQLIQNERKALMMKLNDATSGRLIRVMSSNALFDKTARERAPKLFDNYIYYNPDLIGFQEINSVLHEELIKPLTASDGAPYIAVSAWPDADNKQDFEINSLSKKYPDVNYFPILYRKDRFIEVESGFYMYRSTWTYTKGVTWAVLRERSSGRLLAHINTHAAVMISTYEIENKTPQMAEEWRLDNSRQIIDTWRGLQEKYGNIPTFITGDFNSNESSPSYDEYIKAGLLNSKYVATQSASHNVATFHKVGQMSPQGDDKSPIDHIFISPDNIQVLVHSIETRQEVLESSDHCILYADALLI